MADYLLVAQLSVPAEIEAEFNRLYDEEHIPPLMKLPGVHSATRYKLEWSQGTDYPEYMAVYEIDDPEMPRSKEWRAAADVESWVTKVRPFVRQRWHAVFRKIKEHAPSK